MHMDALIYLTTEHGTAPFHSRYITPNLAEDYVSGKGLNLISLAGIFRLPFAALAFKMGTDVGEGGNGLII